jgi:hypothetical protein
MSAYGVARLPSRFMWVSLVQPGGKSFWSRSGSQFRNAAGPRSCSVENPTPEILERDDCRNGIIATR